MYFWVYLSGGAEGLYTGNITEYFYIEFLIA
jgi:hypothetical protein